MRDALKKLTVPTILALVMAVNGAFSIVAGLASVIRIPAEIKEGGFAGVPKYLQVTPQRHVSAFGFILLGLLLIGLAKGLHDRRRRYWWMSLFVLGAMMAANLSEGVAPQNAAFSGAVLLALLGFHKRFRWRSERFGYAQFLAFASVIFALAYGVVGSYVLRAHFNGLKTWTDALYFTVVTYSTVGYGDIVPVTATARLFVVSMVPIGMVTFFTALTAIFGPLIEQRIKGVMGIMKRFQHLNDHILVCGLTNVSESAIDELTARGRTFVVIEERPEVAEMLREKGYDVVTGDPTRKETLEHANLAESRAILAATDSDATNMLIAITAREMILPTGKRPMRIVIRVENEENVDKARMAGADEVISPSTMGGRLMAVKAVEPHGETPESS